MTQWSHRGPSIVRVLRSPNLVIAAGAIVGTYVRFLLAGLLGQNVPATFPSGTLLVNLGGSLLIGVAHSLFLVNRAWPREIQLLVSVGVLGGFTTFSTFSLETVQLIAAGRVADALIYQGLSLAGAVLAACAGGVLGRRICRHFEWWRRA